jgi:hypothetical protein
MMPALLANSIAADAGLIPGLAIFGPAMGLPLSVLAAFIERPFVTRSGFERNAIWFSLQANFVSLLIGYFATMVVIPLVMSPSVDLVGLVWPFLAVGISIATERLYLTMRLRHGVVPWAPITWGNIISALTCIAVMVIAATLRDAAPQLSADLREHETAMNVSVAVASLLLLVGSFAARAPQHGPQLTTEQSHALEPAAGLDSNGASSPPAQ